MTYALAAFYAISVIITGWEAFKNYRGWNGGRLHQLDHLWALFVVLFIGPMIIATYLVIVVPAWFIIRLKRVFTFS